MKKILLGLLCATTLFTTAGLTASAADTDNPKPQISKGKIEFLQGGLTIDNGATDLTAASLDFGSNKIEAAKAGDKDYRYANINKDAAITVSDLRGSGAGWKLSVKQNDVFKNDKATVNKELTGAILTLNGVLDTDASTTGADANVNKNVSLGEVNSDHVLMDAAVGKGNGNNVANISGSQLTVPLKTARAEGIYSTTLTWSVEATPANS